MTRTESKPHLSPCNLFLTRNVWNILQQLKRNRVHFNRNLQNTRPTMKDIQEQPKTSLIRKIFRRHRPCPNCKRNSVPTGNLFVDGSRCTNCLKDYELDNKWFCIIHGALAVTVWLSFDRDYLPLFFGLAACSCLIVLGTSMSLPSAWFPLEEVDEPNRD